MDKSLKPARVREKKSRVERDKSSGLAFKKILFLFIALFLVVLMFLYDVYASNKRITVARVGKNVTAGDVVKDTLTKYDMLYASFKEAGTVDIKLADGTIKKTNRIVAWKDIGKYQDYYYNSYHQAGSNFTVESSSDRLQYRNPLIESMPIGNEEYVLGINPSGIDIHQLFPGTILRMRVAFKVPLAIEAECRMAVASKSTYDGTSEVLKILSRKGYEVGSTGVESTEIVGPTEGFEGGASSTTAMSNDERTATVSEVIFDNISSIDMKSTSGESIYEVYMALLRMPLEKRVPYMETSFDDDKSGDFRARITPSSLVLSLTREEANALHEFETMRYDTKWTIIKTDTSSDMLKDFIEINEQLTHAGK